MRTHTEPNGPSPPRALEEPNGIIFKSELVLGGRITRPFSLPGLKFFLVVELGWVSSSSRTIGSQVPALLNTNGGFYAGEWLVNPQLNRVERGGEIFHLEPKAMEVLVYLSRTPGEVVSKQELIGHIWRDTFVTDDVLKVCIWQLRKAFHDDYKSPRVIETIPKGGYRLLLPVRQT